MNNIGTKSEHCHRIGLNPPAAHCGNFIPFTLIELLVVIAIIAILAALLLQVLKQTGRTISAVGYDNSEFASLLDPPLTSIEEDAAELGHAVCRTVNELIAGKKPVSREVKPHLIERQSVFSIQDIK